MKNGKSEIFCWITFFIHRLVEFGVLASWVLMAWAFDTYIVRPFPVKGLPKLILLLLEIIFYTYTLFEIAKILYFPKSKANKNLPWWV